LVTKRVASAKGLENKVDGFINKGTQNFPVTPNLIADTKHWRMINGGEVNVEKSLAESHQSPWRWFWHSGGSGIAKLKVVTLNKLNENGIGYGGDLRRVTNSNFYGSDFRILIIDVKFTENGSLYILNQGCPRFTGWSKGEFQTQSSVFVNLIQSTGDIKYSAVDNAFARIDVDSNILGEGWKYLHANKKGFGGCHQPRFTGKKGSHMRVAIALMYAGYGNHEGNFIYANSIGRYSHDTDNIANGRRY